jgi:CheY-like chemotaxis protein
VIPDDGTDVLLEHRSAQAVGMILHELATNAAKHGALSNEAGRVIVSWEAKPDQITLNWREVGGPPTKRPSSEGYGTRVIRGGLLHLGGKAEFNWPSTGLECTLVIPSGSGIPTRLTHLGRLKAEDLPQVLLVEDEPLVAMMMEDSLTHLGFSVIGPHSNVESAAIVARELDLCAALLDINIAGNDIYPVAEICKERGIPVVFVTGYATDHVSKKYAEAAVLQKPIDHQALETLFKGFKQPLYRSA